MHAERAISTVPLRVDIDLPVLGRVALAASADGLCGLAFPGLGDDLPFACNAGHSPLLDVTARQLGEYARGKRTSFDLPLDLSTCTDFTRDVLYACAEIPFGRLLTYGQLAGVIAKPGASRAVGSALGRNPLAIIVPCHRVVGSSGDGGFTAGMHIKYLLWRIEGIRQKSDR